MRRIKNKVALLAVAALSINMTGTVFAQTYDPMQETLSQNVTVDYDAGEVEKTYSVDVEWDSLSFTYKTGKVRTWDATTHTWIVSDATDGTTAGWVNQNGETNAHIKVTNHSNARLFTQLVYNVPDSLPETGFENVRLNMKQTFGGQTQNSTAVGETPFANGMTIPDASVEAENDVENAPYRSWDFWVSGVPDAFEGSVVLGSITIRIQESN